MLTSFAWLPLSSEAACTVTCTCSDRYFSGSETQGPFQSTEACMAAVNDMSARCRFGGPYLVPSCTYCSGCEPTATPSSDPAAAATAARAQEQARQAAFQRTKQKVGSELKLNARAPSSTALQQLGCVQQQSGDPRGGDWSNVYVCTPNMPRVPEPPPPTAVDEFDVIPSEPAALREFLARISARIGATRGTLTKSEQAVAAREQEVARELKTQSVAKDPAAGESDALKRAREALARARAEREKTAAELQRLERQEQSAKAKLPPAAP